jgi:Glycosyltransferase sugar-binding region containing DXD motif
MIPKVLHYCFGLSPDVRKKQQWALIHYACLRSAVERIKPREVRFYCQYEPTGPWWELTRNLVIIEKIDAPRQIFGNPLMHGAHQADVVRLQKLLSKGGIYLDTDVFIHKSFDCLLEHSTVLGEQGINGRVHGLCNAVILAEAQAPFLQKWYAEYKWFRSRGQDRFWDEHSVKVPYALAKEFSNEVTVLPQSAFFFPSCMPEGVTSMFASAEPIDLSGSYASHLWERVVWDRYLENLTPRQVRRHETNFHRWTRPMIATLPDDYGAPAMTARLSRRLRHVKRSVAGLLQHRG